MGGWDRRSLTESSHEISEFVIRPRLFQRMQAPHPNPPPQGGRELEVSGSPTDSQACPDLTAVSKNSTTPRKLVATSEKCWRVPPFVVHTWRELPILASLLISLYFALSTGDGVVRFVFEGAVFDVMRLSRKSNVLSRGGRVLILELAD